MMRNSGGSGSSAAPEDSKQAIAEGETHSRGGGGEGGITGQKKFVYLKSASNFPAPLINFILLPEEKFS